MNFVRVRTRRALPPRGLQCYDVLDMADFHVFTRSPPVHVFCICNENDNHFFFVVSGIQRRDELLSNYITILNEWRYRGHMLG